MRKYLIEDDLLLNQQENFEILTQDKPVLTAKSIDFSERLSDEVSVIVVNSRPQNIKAIETVAHTYNCNVLVVENKDGIIPDLSFLQNNSVVIYGNRNERILCGEPLDKEILDILKELGFYMNSKNTLMFFEIVKEVYNRNNMFYKIEDIYNYVGNKNIVLKVIKLEGM